MYHDGYCFCSDYGIACILYDSCNFCNTYSLNVDNSNIIKHEIKHLLLTFIYIVLWLLSVLQTNNCTNVVMNIKI